MDEMHTNKGYVLFLMDKALYERGIYVPCLNEMPTFRGLYFHRFVETSSISQKSANHLGLSELQYNKVLPRYKGVVICSK